jgi:hypothetical protein
VLHIVLLRKERTQTEGLRTGYWGEYRTREQGRNRRLKKVPYWGAPNIIRTIKSRKMEWTEYLALTEGMENSSVVGKPEKKTNWKI